MRIDQYFVNNQFEQSENGTEISVYNPANEELIAQVPSVSDAEIIRAVDFAATAQVTWRKLSSVERAGFIHAMADALDDCKDAIGQALAQESGKSLEDATNEAVYAAQITRYHAEWARRIEGESLPSDSPNENLILQREPIGVVACLIPFNFPVYTLLRKIAPALITGNTVVIRPSNHTPCSAYEIAKAIQKAGLPAGVVNIATMNHDTAKTMCTHPKVGMISLTGSVEAGRKVLEYSQVNIAKSSLELGGKTPAIIEPDADLAKAAAEIVGSRTKHCGQVCTSVERVYVHDTVYNEFVQLLKDNLAGTQFGDCSVNPSFMGPLNTSDAQSKVQSMVEKAIEEGAQLELGGYIPDGLGHFYPPTLLTNCHQAMQIVQNEVFGPVLPVIRYQDVDEAIELVNDHQFGLASVVYTENYRTAMHVANEIESGEVYINRAPGEPYQGFHAGWKRSGLGGDDGKHGMLEYTQTRLVVMKY